MNLNLNPLMDQAKADRHPDDANCCKDNICKTCGAHVSGYNANEALRAARPEAEHEDWWMACDNADCVHAYGEGQGVSHWPDWIRKDGEEPEESSTERDRRKILGCTPPECIVGQLRKEGLVDGMEWKKEVVDKLNDEQVWDLWWRLEDAGVEG
jgi:hypothetical protein